jgi:hypothetical protein
MRVCAVKVLIIRSAESSVFVVPQHTFSLIRAYSVIFLKLVHLYLIRPIDVTTAD